MNVDILESISLKSIKKWEIRNIPNTIKYGVKEYTKLQSKPSGILSFLLASPLWHIVYGLNL